MREWVFKCFSPKNDDEKYFLIFLNKKERQFPYFGFTFWGNVIEYDWYVQDIVNWEKDKLTEQQRRLMFEIIFDDPIFLDEIQG